MVYGWFIQLGSIKCMIIHSQFNCISVQYLKLLTNFLNRYVPIGSNHANDTIMLRGGWGHYLILLQFNTTYIDDVMLWCLTTVSYLYKALLTTPDSSLKRRKLLTIKESWHGLSGFFTMELCRTHQKVLTPQTQYRVSVITAITQSKY